MAVRILANIEHTLGADLGQMQDGEEFVLHGSDLNIIRSEILNAAGDTSRSLAQLVDSNGAVGKLSFDRATISALNKAILDIVPSEEGEEVPVFEVQGDFNLLHKIRNEVGTGIVYNRAYTCVGVDQIVDSLMPFLDKAQIAGIRIARGEYKGWRDAVCELYLEGLGNE